MATLDTKGREVEFAKEQIERLGARVLLMDAGILGRPLVPPDITREEVASAIGLSMEEVRKMVMGTPGAIGIGPNGLIGAGMRVPKSPTVESSVVFITKGEPSPKVLKLIELIKDVEFIP